MHLWHCFLATKKPTDNRFLPAKLGWLKACILLNVLTMVSPTNATEVGRHSLSLQEAVALSLESNPDLAGYDYRLQSAKGHALQAGAPTPPEIGLEIEDALGTGDYSNLDSAQTTLSIGWILEEALIDKRVQAAEASKSLVEVNYQIQRFDIATETARDFLTVLAFQERLAVAEEAHANAQGVLAEVTRRVDAAITPLADKLRAEVNVERHALEVEDLEHELLSAKRMLAAQWGATTVEFDRVTGSLTPEDTLSPYAQIEAAITKNPSLRHFLTQERVAESEIALARAETRNQWKFSAGIRQFEATDDYGVVARVSVPLGGSTRNQGRISALTAEQGLYQSESHAAVINLKTQLFVLYQELQHARHISDALAARIIPRLERALAETQKAYQLGKYTYLEWVSIQQELLDAKLTLIDVGLTSQLNAIEIERLTGQSLSLSSEEA
jgi:cobalt-zinc-cadmium efflux system outer membrane protein